MTVSHSGERRNGTYAQKKPAAFCTIKIEKGKVFQVSRKISEKLYEVFYFLESDHKKELISW